MKIWVDDIRTPPDGTVNGLWANGWLWFKDSWSVMDFINDVKDANKYKIEHGVEPIVIDLMSLDHDLGGDDTTRPIVLWMCENEFWPVEIRVHSMNPVGRSWLESMIERYKP